jgi:integrase
MRIPHYLVRTSSGTYHFRLKVPAALQAALGVRVVKRSLATRDARTAQIHSSLLYLRYASAIAAARGGDVMPKPPSVEDLLASFQQGGIRPFELELDPATRFPTRIQTDGSPQDNAAALEAMKVVFATPLPARALPSPKPPSMSLGEALRTYELTEAPSLTDNTRRQRARACASFLKALGAATPVADITRPMAAAWSTELIAGGMAKRTAANNVSHVAQLFEMLIARGQIEQGKNPVKGVVVMSKQEKRRRKAGGHTWEPFELGDLKRLFAPENFRRLTSDHARWGALIGLYTGARVGEVAQLYLRDFSTEGAQPFVLVRADSDGQSVKTESSERKVPLHPDLIELGLLRYVDQMKRSGAERLFPNMRIDSNAGSGNALSKAFSYYLNQLGVKPRRENGRVGFHPLRKNVVQAMQGAKVPGELRRAFVGHEVGDKDVHEEIYMREWTAEELATLFPGLPWGTWLSIEAVCALLRQEERRL